MGSVIVNRRQLGRLARDDLVNYISVTADPTSDLHTVSDDIRRQVAGRYRLRILTLGEFLASAQALVGQVFHFTRAVTWITLLIANIALLQSIVSGALERRRTLSILRAVGASRRHLRRAFIAEGLVIGVLGGGLGLAAGVLLSFLWLDIHLPYLLGWAVPIRWPWGTYALAGGLAILWSVVSAFVAAGRLARLARAEDLVSG